MLWLFSPRRKPAEQQSVKVAFPALEPFTMTAIQELNKRLQDLPEAKREAVASVLLEALKAQEWDEQIATDVETGKLDHLIEEVEADIAAGRVRPL